MNTRYLSTTIKMNWNTVYSSKDTLFATPGVNIGLFCSTPMVAVSRKVSRKKTMKMLLTGDSIDAKYAKEIGLINDYSSQYSYFMYQLEGITCARLHICVP